MDTKQEDMQFLSLFGICQEACKIIFSWRKIFSQITLRLILPLTSIFLAHIEVSDLLLSIMDVHDEELASDKARAGTTPKQDNFFITLGLFDFAYVTFVLILYLFSTSAVVYTIACIYTGREVTFEKLMSIVPKVWKRLMLTFTCTFIVFLAYSIVGALLIINLLKALFRYVSTSFAVALFMKFVPWIFYLVGIFYIIAVWHLASTVTVLEDTCGIRAMIKSKALMKGKIGVATFIFLMLYISGLLIEAVLKKMVEGEGRGLSLVNRVAYEIICLLLFSKLILFGLVIQPVIYLVCKSYHHENIDNDDKTVLLDHLEVYVKDYVTLKAKDAEVERF